MALTPSVRADYVVLDNDFNNASNNVANNDLGIGHGVTTLVPVAAANTYARETNSLMQISSDINGADRGIWDSIDGISINGGGTTFEFRNVSFTNQPSNTGTGPTDRTLLAVTASAVAADWVENGTAGIPAGFWLQMNSDGEAAGTGNGSPIWNGNTSLFYTDGQGNRTVLLTWTFDNLKWGPNAAFTNYAPVLDIKLTVSGTGLAFSVTGDTQGGGSAIGVTNTYAGLGFTPNLINGLSSAHMGAVSQTENPGIIMSVDRILATHLGGLAVTTPQISTPEYGFNTNVVLAQEAISFTSTVITNGLTPSLQWQLEDLSSPGTFTNIPGAITTNLVFNTIGFGDSQTRHLQLVANDGLNNVTSPAVTVTVNPSVAPQLVQDVPAGPIVITVGSTLSLSTIFYGNLPMTNRWWYSVNNTVFAPLSTQTNQTLFIPGIGSGASGYYEVFVTNAIGQASSSIVQIQVVPPNPIYPSPGSYGSYALYTNNATVFYMLNETNDLSTGFVQAYDFTGGGHNGFYRNGAQGQINGVLSPQPPAFPGFDLNEGAVLIGGGSATNTLVTVPPLNLPTNITDTTISCWIMPSSNPQGNATIFNSRSTTGGHTDGIQYNGANLNGLRVLGYNWNDSATAYNWNSGITTPVGTWAYIVLVIQTNGATLYANYVDPNSGQPVLLSAFNAQTCHPENFLDGTNFVGHNLIGDDFSFNNRTFPGTIADFAIYHAALSQAQVQKMFAVALGVSGFPAAVVTQPPSSVSAYAGYRVVIPAKTSGSGTVTNRWQLNGTNLTDGNFAGTLISGSGSPTLTINQALPALNNGVFTLTTSNALGGAVSSSTTLTVLTPVAPTGTTLLGEWAAGTPNFKDVSGHSTPGKHDGYLVNGSNFYFTNDVPSVAAFGSKSLRLGNVGLVISNSSTVDASYDNTFDVGISNAMTVTFWAKGWPGQWNPFVSKYGENNVGWQLRNYGVNNVSPCWTMRGSSGTAGDDMGATSLTYGNDQLWHFYAGTYDVSTGIRALYVDGNLAVQSTGNGQYTIGAAEHLAIGARDASGTSFGNYYTGLIYDVRIYNTALGPDQQAYVGTTPPPPPPNFASSLYVPGSGFVVSWYGGTLLEATNVTGPWVTNSVQTSPFTNSAALPKEFFRVVH